MSGPKYLAVIVAVLTLAALVSAVVLTCLNHPAQEAWAAAGIGFAYLTGLHTPTASSSGGS